MDRFSPTFRGKYRVHSQGLSSTCLTVEDGTQVVHYASIARPPNVINILTLHAPYACLKKEAKDGIETHPVMFKIV
jgi:hypothetical protein